MKTKKFQVLTHLVDIGLPDVCWQPAINESEDLEEDEVIESGTDFLVGSKWYVRFPFDDRVGLFEVVDDDPAVLVVEADGSHGRFIILEVDQVEEMDALGLDIIVFPEFLKNPLEAFAVLQDCCTVTLPDSPGDCSEEDLEVFVPV